MIANVYEPQLVILHLWFEGYVYTNNSYFNPVKNISVASC